MKEEYLDIVNEKGEPTGETIERNAAHALGIRHRTSHVWLLRKKEGEVQILLQKRSDNKDSHPGCYDISSAGHIPAGIDFLSSAIRELEEELGVKAKEEELHYCGQRTFTSCQEFYGKPFHDNQVSNIYVLWLDKEEGEFKLQREEVSEVIWMNFKTCIKKIKENEIPHCIHMEELKMIQKYIEKATMKVYYIGNSPERGKRRRAGKEISIQKSFIWGNEKWNIPAVYQCPEGLVADFILCVPVEKAKKYFEKWNYVRRISELTNEEFEEMARDNPFLMNFSLDAWINGKEYHAENMYGLGYHPLKNESIEKEQEAFSMEEAYCDEDALRLMEVYQCDKNNAYYFVRAYFPWKKIPEIEHLSFSMEPNCVSYSGEHFHTKLGDEGKEIEISHPVTGKKYVIRILLCKQGILSVNDFGIGEDMEYPENYLSIEYTAEPEISRMEFQIQDCKNGDQPIKKKRPIYDKEDKSSANVSIISSSDGPTSIFLAGKSSNPKTHAALSSLYFHSVDSAEWRTIFHVKERQAKRIDIK